MNSLLFAFIGYTILAIVSILDKSILTSALKKPFIYAFFSTIVSSVTFVLIPYFGFPLNVDGLWAIASGLAFGFGVWTMYIAFRHGEASHLSPFIGAIVAATVYVLSFLILDTTISQNQSIGVLLLIAASFLLSFEKLRGHKGFDKSFLWGILAGVLFAISHICAKYIYLHYPFINGLVWTKSTIGLVGILIILIPSYRRQIFHKNHNKKIKEGQPKKKKTAWIVSINKVLGIVSTLFIQYAISIGNVAVVNALAGLQYVLIFIFIFTLTKIRPKLFSEYFTRREMIVESSAIILVVVGLLFLS